VLVAMVVETIVVIMGCGDEEAEAISGYGLLDLF
jgi:hypothetical protein